MLGHYDQSFAKLTKTCTNLPKLEKWVFPAVIGLHSKQILYTMKTIKVRAFEIPVSAMPEVADIREKVNWTTVSQERMKIRSSF